MSDANEFLKAVQEGEGETVRRLLAEDPALAAATNEGGVSAPLLALYHGRGALAALLAAHRADLTVWEAAALGDTARLEALLAADPALINAVAADGFFPLGLAAFFGREDAVAALLARGADPDQAAANPMRVRAIHAAVANRKPEISLAIAQRLLAAGAAVNVAQQGGWTPLHQAADHGHEALARLLLAAGADPTARADDGRTPADMARAKGFDALAAHMPS